MSMIERAASAAALFLVLFGPAVAAEQPAQVPANAAQIQLSFAPVVKRVAPAVVNVYASRTVAPQASPFFVDPFFRQFFGGGGQAASPRVEQSLGSGVIIDPSGLVVTNYHVIAQADDVKVALADKRELAADIVLKDERSDLAVLKVREPGGALPTIAFADSDQVQVGDLVLAIGDPFGVGQTVTSGIVSAFARLPGGPSDDQYFIQTDAAINPGNSGGALVDTQGRLIGINRMIVSPSGASSGIGFAIPSNLVRTVSDAAAKGTSPHRPRLGASLQAVTPQIADGLGMAAPTGALVASVDKGGPADLAGLKTGDVILSIDSVNVDDVGALNYRLATKPIGGTAKLGVQRDGKLYATSLPLQAAPESPAREAISIVGSTPFAGLTILNLSPAVAEELAYEGAATTGVIISDVKANSAAANVGFKRGDVIVDVNGTKIDTTKRLADLTQQSAANWTLTIKRGDQTLRQQFRG
jgi:Do/DeqQ family serine protease